MNQEDVIKVLRGLKYDYIHQGMAKNPAALPEHFAQFLGYATFLYEFYADKLEAYERLEAKVVSEETDKMNEHNAKVSKREDRMTVAELENRIDIRLAEEKGKKKRLEQLVKGNTLHINGCQSIMKTWGDEAKGMR